MDSSSRLNFIQGKSDTRVIRAYYHTRAGYGTKRQAAQVMQSRPYCTTNLKDIICYAFVKNLSPNQMSYITGKASNDVLINLIKGLHIDRKVRITAAQTLQKRPLCDSNKNLIYCSVFKKTIPIRQAKTIDKKVIKKEIIKNTANQLKWAKSVISKPTSKFSTFFPKDINYEKGRYETTNEYQLRKKISWAKKLMYFDIKSQLKDLDYDADTTTLTVFHSTQEDLYGGYRGSKEAKKLASSFLNGHSSQKSNLIGLSDFFLVNTTITDLGSYTGENAYGAKREVSRAYMEQDKVYFSNLNYFKTRTNIDIGTKKDPLYNSGVNILKTGIKHSLSIPRSKIESVEKNIRLRIVVKKPNSILFYAQSSIATTATIDNPSELTSKTNYIRSDLVGIVLYNKKTKEIYAAYKL